MSKRLHIRGLESLFAWELKFTQLMEGTAGQHTGSKTAPYMVATSDNQMDVRKSGELSLRDSLTLSPIKHVKRALLGPPSSRPTRACNGPTGQM